MPVRTLWLVRHGESVGNVAAARAESDGLDRIPLGVANDRAVEGDRIGIAHALAGAPARVETLPTIPGFGALYARGVATSGRMAAAARLPGGERKQKSDGS